MKEINLFKKRILGLTSYFRSASESLLPKYDGIPKVFQIDMSPHQLGIYERARAAERKEEKEMLKKLKQKKVSTLKLLLHTEFFLVHFATLYFQIN